MYFVVLEGVGEEKNGNHLGIRTIIPFPSEEAYLKWERARKNADIIVAAGVSEEQAQELASQTTVKARLNALTLDIDAHPQHADMYMMNTSVGLRLDMPSLFRRKRD